MCQELCPVILNECQDLCPPGIISARISVLGARIYVGRGYLVLVPGFMSVEYSYVQGCDGYICSLDWSVAARRVQNGAMILIYVLSHGGMG